MEITKERYIDPDDWDEQCKYIGHLEGCLEAQAKLIKELKNLLGIHE